MYDNSLSFVCTDFLHVNHYCVLVYVVKPFHNLLSYYHSVLGNVAAIFFIVFVDMIISLAAQIVMITTRCWSDLYPQIPWFTDHEAIL